ncbi:MAG: nitroreductase family protein [Candidatus Omnitrophica bacterium]|nr:nitroreductase family protein [Candidatus Omnitrophota bacterium]
MDTVFKRRSVRKYIDKDVPEEFIKKILEAGMSAPSAGNEQPWHFIVIRKKDTLKDIAQVSPYAYMLKDANVGIVVCGDLSLEKHKGYWVQDCSAAVENMLIEVAELELGAVWLGVYPVEERVVYIKRFFKLPNNIIPFAIVSIGYPLSNPEPQIKYLKERVHYEEW